jgi:hypothetical protein
MYWRMAEQPARRLDECTFHYGDDDNWRVMRFDPRTELYQVCEHSPQPEPTFEDLERGVASMEQTAGQGNPQPSDWPDLVAAVEEFGGRRAIPGFGTGLGIPRDPIWLEACALRPDLVARYLDCALAGIPGTIAAMKEIGLTYLCGGGDFAGARGPMYSPKVFHELMMPRLAQITEWCHEAGCYHGFASDGNLWSIADDLFGAAAVDFFYELDRQAGMDLARMRTTFPEVTLWGGINSATLHRGTAEEVREETLTALEQAKEHTSMVIGCSNQIVAGTPPENIEVMLETLAENR